MCWKDLTFSANIGSVRETSYMLYTYTLYKILIEYIQYTSHTKYYTNVGTEGHALYPLIPLILSEQNLDLLSTQVSEIIIPKSSSKRFNIREYITN